MRRTVTALLATAWLLPTPALAAGTRASAASPPGPATGAPALPLGHSGRWITDARGRVVILHGTNMVYKIAPYYPQAIGFGDDDAAFLASIGFDAVRVGVLWQAVEPRPGVYDDGYLAHIAQTVSTLARHGIVSLLDFHQDQYNQRFQGEGFPDWSVQDDGLPAQPQLGFGGDYVGMPALEHAFDHFWADSAAPDGKGLQEHYAAAWRHVAARFARTRAVMGYEVMNEPWPGSVWPSCAQTQGCPTFDTGPFAAFYDKVIRAIRSVDRSGLIWYEPQVLFNYGSKTNLPPLGDRRLGFAFHDYCLQKDEGGGTGSCQTFDDTVFANALSRVGDTGDALLETEFGATTDPNVLGPAIARADADMVPWLEWAYCGCNDPTTSGPGAEQAIVLDPAKPPRGANLNRPTLGYLVEPYPLVVAGTPLAWAFNRSQRSFTLRYAAARAGGRGRFPARSISSVAVPRYVYGRGYAVRVEGAAVVSRSRAGTLLLALCPRASGVSVTITPRGRSRASCRIGRAARRRGFR